MGEPALIEPVQIDWPPDYLQVLVERNERLIKIKADPELLAASKVYYRHHPAEFIEHWMNTYDPRNAGTGKPARMPFILFPKQHELINYLTALVEHQENGLIEKARDMGATWCCGSWSVWAFLFLPGASIGWGSRKENLVDKMGDPDSIFEKLRIMLRDVPAEYKPAGFNENNLAYMKIINPDTGATITGESGDNIGRGGRSLIYFKDEAAHYERPERIEAALADNTNVQIDISSVNGVGNVFHRRREAGEEWSGTVKPGKTHVFVMDWRDHPAKDQAWYDARRQRAVDEGMLHLFAQEVDRSYTASVEGILIPQDWVLAAIDAHIKLGFDDSGGYGAALDVADEGADRNAQAIRKGVILKSLEEWTERDTGVSARKSVKLVEGMVEGMETQVQYDCIGVGSGVKAEINRLQDDEILPANISYVPWNAGAKVLDPKNNVIKGDRNSPLNEDFYQNLKAQAGWNLRLRFERTWQAVNNGYEFSPDDMISIDGNIPLLHKLTKELSQATVGQSSRLKMMINKNPPGTKSPNLADAVSMCFFPIPSGSRYTFKNL